MNRLIQQVAPAVALCLAPLMWAHAAGKEPAQTTASAALKYRSVFEHYTAWQDTKPGDWRALNEAVKADSMAGTGMSGMRDMGSMSGMGGVGVMLSPEMPMPAASAPAPAAHAHDPKRATAMPAMPGMPGMPAHAGHDVTGGKQ